MGQFGIGQSVRRKEDFRLLEGKGQYADDYHRPGEAFAYLDSGATSLGGKQPVNPSGGLLSRGHPVGATGIVQAAEIVRQLNGRAGAHQVEGAKIGLSHATGGGVAGFDHGACSIHIFAK